MQVLEPFIQGFSIRILLVPVRPDEALVKVLLYPESKERLASTAESNNMDIGDPSIPSIILGMDGREAKGVKLFPPDTSSAGLAVLPVLEVIHCLPSYPLYFLLCSAFRPCGANVASRWSVGRGIVCAA